MADDEVEWAAKPRRQARVGQVAGNEADAAHLPGAALQAPGDRNGTGAEIDGDYFRVGQFAPQVERLGSIAASGHEDAARRAIAGLGAPDRLDPFLDESPRAALKRLDVAERIRASFVDSADLVGYLHSCVSGFTYSGQGGFEIRQARASMPKW